MAYLTKSRFKLAHECETKLFYYRKPEYADQSADDPFLLELAKGGYQVGELAKYYFADDASEITVTETRNEEALEETNRRIARGDRKIAEASVRFENLFIRTDLLEIDTSKKAIRFYEVKSKSWDASDKFCSLDREGNIRGLQTEWKSYLYDVAFQKYVLIKAFPGYAINAFLTVVNKESHASVDGLNQLFRVRKNGDRYEIVPNPGINRDDLGTPVLINLPMDEIAAWIMNSPVESANFPDYSFSDYVNVLSEVCLNGRKIESMPSKRCKKCQFHTKSPEQDAALRSGIKECWTERLEITPQQFARPKVISIFGLSAPKLLDNLMGSNKFFISDVAESDIYTAEQVGGRGMSWNERRWKQVEKVQANDHSFYLDKDGLRAEMDSWKWPLHFIDFETSSPALPFTSGSAPYEGIAFQYSHHTISRTKNGSYSIEHRNQFLHTVQGVNPNLDFIRELKRDLSEDEGTIFRYHRHENTYLRMIHSQLQWPVYNGTGDRDDLLTFIDSITQNKINTKENRSGPRNMVDLWELVARYYYPPHAEGSTSLKKILPAAIHDSSFLRGKYSMPVCGRNREVNSRNFDEQTWIDPAYNNDPYKKLPPVFENFTREELDEMFNDMDDLADGGAAMMAYAKLQFVETPDDQRNAIREALYKYCELDTLAMVMLWEFWNNELNN